MPKETQKRRGGVNTDEAKRAVACKIRRHREIKKTKTNKCQNCNEEKPEAHILIHGVRTWLCGKCLTADTDENYLDQEVERITRTGLSPSSF